MNDNVPRGLVTAELARVVMERADTLAGHSETAGEITRSYGTAALTHARDAVRSWMEEAGMTVAQDSIGNLVGRWEASDRTPSTFLLGSHIDSVQNAGRYDGPLGVLTAIACVEELRQRDTRLPFSVELVAFIDEEGLRYHASYLGSRVFAGIFDDAELELEDKDGVPLAEAVRAMGGDPQALAEAKRATSDLIGYCEVHIEQGPLLEALDLPVGVVTSIAGQSRGTVRFVGGAGHAGTVPMDMRRDALCAASEFVLAVEDSTRAEPGLIATVGRAIVAPGVGNVIPGVCELTFDVRHRDDETRARALRSLQERAGEICARRRIELAWETLQEHAAVPFSPRLVEYLARAVESTCGRAQLMASGAGHDTVSVAHLADVSMLFVRCKGGVSHHPDESVDVGDVAIAIETLGTFLCTIAAELVSDDGRSRPTSAAGATDDR